MADTGDYTAGRDLAGILGAQRDVPNIVTWDHRRYQHWKREEVLAGCNGAFPVEHQLHPGDARNHDSPAPHWKGAAWYHHILQRPRVQRKSTSIALILRLPRPRKDKKHRRHPPRHIRRELHRKRHHAPLPRPRRRPHHARPRPHRQRHQRHPRRAVVRVDDLVLAVLDDHVEDVARGGLGGEVGSDGEREIGALGGAGHGHGLVEGEGQGVVLAVGRPAGEGHLGEDPRGGADQLHTAWGLHHNPVASVRVEAEGHGQLDQVKVCSAHIRDRGGGHLPH
mmetsp:Transcript_109538/g.251175  ORF Transcript_109538/g.251175 Transcript_109538/m.251175 type:complete len:280 (-) Transcript_109538:1133-1972(-)